MLSDIRTYLRSGDPAPKAFTFDRLDFEPGTSRMRRVDVATIQILAAILEDHPNVRVRVGFGEGERASAESQLLSWNRAQAIVVALRKAGVASSRLEATAGGKGNRQRAPQLIVLQK
jgi:outer membrane protein OmpA-like peptidoglycan-associated protein